MSGRFHSNRLQPTACSFFYTRFARMIFRPGPRSQHIVYAAKSHFRRAYSTWWRQHVMGHGFKTITCSTMLYLLHPRRRPRSQICYRSTRAVVRQKPHLCFTESGIGGFPASRMEEVGLGRACNYPKPNHVKAAGRYSLSRRDS